MRGSDIQIFARYAQTVHTQENYSAMVFFMFFDQIYTLSKAQVLREFTHQLMKRRLLIADDICEIYNTFILERYQFDQALELLI
jgi:hypothetical protein